MTGFLESKQVYVDEVWDLINQIRDSLPFKQISPDEIELRSLQDDLDVANAYLSLFKPFDNFEPGPISSPFFKSLENSIIEGLKHIRFLENIQEGFDADSEYTAAIHYLKREVDRSAFRTQLMDLAYDMRIGAGFEELIARVEEQLESNQDIEQRLIDLDKHTKEWVANLKETTNEQSKLLALKNSKANELLGEITVRKQSKIFHDESDRHEKDAGKFFWAAVALFSLLISAAVVACFLKPDPADLFFYSLSKFTVLSIGLLVGYFLVRNYSSCKHNAVINRHRAHALDTFKYFRDAVDEDPDTKRQVLIETTKVIFTPVNSGYLKAASETSPSNQIVEIFGKVPGQ